jgi:UDP-N-acetylmuramate: L-alanyl-gamma-D-glutamyl-meso-diaminopimelate ligase
MDKADVAYVYFNPEVIEHKRLQPITADQVKEAFGREDLIVFTDANQLVARLREINFEGKALLMMSSGNFSGLDIIAFEKELLGA